MKEPWQVYFESFEHHARNVPLDRMPLQQGSPEAEALYRAFLTARESTAYHLIGELRWNQNRALDLMDEFFDVSAKWLGESPAIYRVSIIGYVTSTRIGVSGP